MLAERSIVLQSTIYKMLSLPSTCFYGFVLQCLDIKFKNDIATAGIYFDKNINKFNIIINPAFFCNLPIDNRIAILHHEILHFTHNHLVRINLTNASHEEKILYNLAMDMAINQYIKNLPEECVSVKDWKLDDTTPFPLERSAEEYYELIKKTTTQNRAKGEGTKINDSVYDKVKPFDEHDWQKLSEEEKQQALTQVKQVFERSIEKTEQQLGKAKNVPDHIREQLKLLDIQMKKFNAKTILKNAVKRTVTSFDRDSSWNRRNKRYGNLAPGSKCKDLPKLNIYCDTSGSISVNELNQFMKVIDSFTQAGASKISLVFWHDNIYNITKHSKNKKIEYTESGGTNIACVLQHIQKNTPNLSIILTDGFFSHENYKLKSEVIFIISKGGNKDHPLTECGKTISLEEVC